MRLSDRYPYDIRLAHTDDTTRANMIAAAAARVQEVTDELGNLHLIAAAYLIRSTHPTAATIVVKVADFDRDEPHATIIDVLNGAGQHLADQATTFQGRAVFDQAANYLSTAFTSTGNFGVPGGLEYRDDLDEANSYHYRHYQVTIDALPGFDGSMLTWHETPDDSSPHVGDVIYTGASLSHLPYVYRVARGHVDRRYITTVHHPGQEEHLGAHTDLAAAKAAAEAHLAALTSPEPDPCPAGDPACETGDDGSCHDGCTSPDQP
jgi:hypothetical protein